MSSENEPVILGGLLYDDTSYVDRTSESRRYRKEWLKVTLALFAVLLVGGGYMAWGWMATGDIGVLVPLLILIIVGALVAVLASMRTVPLVAGKERVLRVYENGIFMPWYSLLDFWRGQFIPFRDIVNVELNEAPYKPYARIELTAGHRRYLWKDDIGDFSAFKAALTDRVPMSEGALRRRSPRNHTQ